MYIQLIIMETNEDIDLIVNHPKKAIGFSLGLVFIFYILNVLSELSENVEFLKYFSIYTLADTRNVISKVTINPLNIIISLIITTIFIVGTFIRYNKKELI